MTFAELTRIAQTSGDILYLMGVLLFAAIVVTLERYWALRQMLTRGVQWLLALRSHARLDAVILKELLAAGAPGPHARVVAAGLSVQPGEPAARIADLLEESLLEQVPRVDRGLWILDTIVTLAPLLGLLGTIIGMFNTFQALSNPGAAAQQVTGGVGEALVATASGLFIAILGLLAFNFLNQRVRLLIHQLERIKLVLLNRLVSGPNEQTAGLIRQPPGATVGTSATTVADRAKPEPAESWPMPQHDLVAATRNALDQATA